MNNLLSIFLKIVMTKGKPSSFSKLDFRENNILLVRKLSIIDYLYVVKFIQRNLKGGFCEKPNFIDYFIDYLIRLF